jgi:hypothetical protein
MTLDERRLKAGRECLLALGARWRKDWSGFDGRLLREQLSDVVLVMGADEPERLAEVFVDTQRGAMDVW